jgi:hypothetical protein
MSAFHTCVYYDFVDKTDTLGATRVLLNAPRKPRIALTHVTTTDVHLLWGRIRN